MTSSELYELTVERFKPKFNPIQLLKLRRACEKAIEENEPLSIEDYLIATKIYLNYIRDFPELQLD